MIPKDLFQRIKDKLAENLPGRKLGPFCIDLVISDACNLRCLYCSSGDRQPRHAGLSRDALVNVLDSAKDMLVKEISLTSLVGEPTIFKDIKFLMEEIKKRNFIGTLLSNGALLDMEMAEFLWRIGWNIIILSIDSFNPEIQYRIRPSKTGKEYIGRILDFMAYAAKNNPALDINLNMVVNNQNYDSVAGYFKIAGGYGVKNITLLRLAKMNEAYEKFCLSESQLAEFKDIIGKIKTNINFNRIEWLGDNDKPCFGQVKENLPRVCYFHFTKILIDCDGRILKCNGDPASTKFNVNTDSLSMIYKDLFEDSKALRNNPPCWDICCSPIKALNQGISSLLAREIK